jgi:hypothetical protein
VRSSDAPVERHASTISVLLRWMAHETRGRDGSQAIPFPRRERGCASRNWSRYAQISACRANQILFIYNPMPSAGLS